MSNNAPDYTDNLAFPPQGDWSDTQPKNNTDRTTSTIELVNKIEKLSKQLDVKEAMIKNYTAEIETHRQQIEEANKIILSFDRLVGKLTGTVFQNVLDYYKKYNISREKGS